LSAQKEVVEGGGFHAGAAAGGADAGMRVRLQKAIQGEAAVAEIQVASVPFQGLGAHASAGAGDGAWRRAPLGAAEIRKDCGMIVKVHLTANMEKLAQCALMTPELLAVWPSQAGREITVELPPVPIKEYIKRMPSQTAFCDSPLIWRATRGYWNDLFPGCRLGFCHHQLDID
jgi:hypothetical protein